MAFLFERLVIIGCGSVGTAFAAAARAAEIAARITAVDTTADALARMLEAGNADEAMFDPRPAVARADAVAVCVPATAVVQMLWTIIDDLQPGTFVLDTSASKARVVRETDEFMPLTVHYISSHPFMPPAGKADAGSSEPFRGGVCVLTPSESTKPEALEKALALYRAFGMRVVQMDASEHDIAVAALDQLPPILSVATLLALDGAAGELPSFTDLGTGPLIELTRHAPASPERWSEILLENSDQVIFLLDRLNKVITGMKDALKSGNADAVRELLQVAAELRPGQ